MTSALDPSDRAVERSMNAIRCIARALRLNSRAIESTLGVSLAQLFVLQHLAESPATSNSDLADRTATHKSSVSVVVGRLVKRGLVTRTASSSDRRRCEIALTAAGWELLEGAPITVPLALVAALRRMTRADHTALADLLERWLRDAHIDLTVPPMFGEKNETPKRSRSVTGP